MTGLGTGDGAARLAARGEGKLNVGDGLFFILFTIRLSLTFNLLLEEKARLDGRASEGTVGLGADLTTEPGAGRFGSLIRSIAGLHIIVRAEDFLATAGNCQYKSNTVEGGNLQGVDHSLALADSILHFERLSVELARLAGGGLLGFSFALFGDEWIAIIGLVIVGGDAVLGVGVDLNVGLLLFHLLIKTVQRKDILLKFPFLGSGYRILNGSRATVEKNACSAADGLFGDGTLPRGLCGSWKHALHGSKTTSGAGQSQGRVIRVRSYRCGGATRRAGLAVNVRRDGRGWR